MTIAPRPRFSIRVGLATAPEDDGPFDGVPEHLLTPLQDWVKAALTESVAAIICLQLRLPPGRTPHGQTSYTRALARTTDALLLDVVDELLLGQGADDHEIDELREILEYAGSAYQVNEDGDGLEDRVAPAVRNAAHQTIADAAAQSTAGSAADHLAAAWRAAYGRKPDPVRTYSESIKAVECATKAIIEPNNSKATLGSMLSVLRNSRQKFTTEIPSPGDPIAPVEAMMRTLWEGQTSRHGSDTPTVPESLEAARAGVHLAAVLVQWFASGAVTRIP
ncbi:hypothetical protein [Streptomyces hydrogenans]|uniref:hypothetical protein n=1 Tax=Streptomyces hydrogenans TaxID=1873719 RepID=UPI0035D9C33F